MKPKAPFWIGPIFISAGVAGLCSMIGREDIASGIFLGVFFSLFFALMAVEAAKDLARAMEETECCMRCPDCPPDSGTHGAGSFSLGQSAANGQGLSSCPVGEPTDSPVE